MENPYLSFGGDSSGGYPAYGGDPSTFTCAIDGMQINCSSLNKFYLSKNWTFVLSKIIHGRFGGALNKSEATLIPGGDHVGNVVYGSAGPGGEVSSVEIIAEPDSFELRSVGTMMNWIEMKPLETMSIAHAQERRQMSTDEVSKMIDDILKLFEDHPGCEEQTNKLLSEMASSSGFKAGSIREILENFRRNGTTYTRDTVNGTGAGSAGTGIGGRPSVSLTYGTTTEHTALTLMHEIIHWAGMPPKVGGYADHYNDKAMATAWHKLGVVMSVDEYRRTYPKVVEEDTKRDGYDFAESRLAGAANAITCLGAVNGVAPKKVKERNEQNSENKSVSSTFVDVALRGGARLHAIKRYPEYGSSTVH